MIVKTLDCNDPAEVGDAAIMILMIMSRNQMIYFSDTCLFALPAGCDWRLAR